MSEDPPTDYLTADQIAARLSVAGKPICGKTIRQWHAAGIIPSSINEGRTIRFDFEEVKAALKKRAAKKARKPDR